jgi:hypothetical protein
MADPGNYPELLTMVYGILQMGDVSPQGYPFSPALTTFFMDDIMKKRGLLPRAPAIAAGLLVLTLVTLAASGCLAPGTPGSPSTPTPTPTVDQPLSLSINATPSRYSPVMSSTIGIRLTPVNTSGILPPDAIFTWETTFGSFYHWGAPDFKVVELGTQYTGDTEPVYWSYFSEHGEKERRPVTITLSVWDPSTRAFLANASLRIGWEDPDGFTAVVEGPG